MKDIIKQAIIDTNFYDSMEKTNIFEKINIMTFQNLDLSKTETLYLKKHHNLSSEDEIFLIFNNEIRTEGDFFTASRTYRYSLVFLENSFKFFRIIETSGWDKEEDLFDEIPYTAIENVEVFENFVRFFGYGSNEYFDLDVEYFGLKTFGYKDPIEPFFAIIINKLKEDYDKNFEEGEKYQAEFWKEYENGNYEKALEISNVFQLNYLQEDWNKNNMSTKEQIVDIPNFWINKAQVLTMLGHNDKASEIYDTIIGFEENDENNYFISRAKIWKSKILEESENYYEALQNLNEGLPHSKRRDDYVYNPERSNKLYTKYIESFKELPYKDRKVIYITNSTEKYKSDALTVLQANQLPDITFPAHHPINNETYIGHPFNNNLYIPIQNYDNELLIDRINEFCYLLQCLGAESITIENINSDNNSNKTNQQTGVNVGVSGLKLGAEVDNKNTQKKSSENQISLRIGKNQTFNPTKFPYVPNDLTWLTNEAGWQRLIKQRLEGSLLEHNEFMSSNQSQILNTNEINDLKVDLKVFFNKANVNVKKDIDAEIKNSSSTEWKVQVKFKPIDQFTPNAIVEDDSIDFVQLPTSNNINENEFLEEYKFLIADGELSEKDQRILDRLRQRLNISEERATELINSLNNYSNEEQELIYEVKYMLQDGEISEREERILLRFANKLGITNERCLELIESLKN